MIIPAQDHRKLTFIYLANDVVQNGRRKGPELAKAFAPTLKKAFEHMAKIPGEKTKKSLLRILAIWKERGIYDLTLIDDFEKTYLKAWDELRLDDEDELDLITGITTPPDPTPTGSQASSTVREEPVKKKKRQRTQKEEIESALRKRRVEATNTVDEWETDGVVQLEVNSL